MKIFHLLLVCLRLQREQVSRLYWMLGGMDAPMPQELPNVVDIFSPNESELRRISEMTTESFEQIVRAVMKCHKMVSVRIS